MSPKELRAFRESTGASRREFARQLFISLPTLERWERGQGAPREIHLRILREMRERRGSPKGETYFQYDPSSTAPAAELLGAEKRLVIDTLSSMAAVLLEEHSSEDGMEWDLRFGLGWAEGEPLKATLSCEGSQRAERPSIDFILELTGAIPDPGADGDPLRGICFKHRLSWQCARTRGGRTCLFLGQRVFKTGFNVETIRHVFLNYHSCWRRMRGELLQPQGAPEGAKS